MNTDISPFSPAEAALRAWILESVPIIASAVPPIYRSFDNQQKPAGRIRVLAVADILLEDRFPSLSFPSGVKAALADLTPAELAKAAKRACVDGLASLNGSHSEVTSEHHVCSKLACYKFLRAHWSAAAMQSAVSALD